MFSNQLYSLKISQVQPETESAVCISFEVPQELKDVFRFKPGQFLTLEIELDGQKVRRAYSICSGVDDTHLRIGIKRIKHGQFSNYANDHFKVGDIVSVLPPQGNFYPLLYAGDTNSYMCLAVGSGITPILSIVKSILSSSDKSEVTLIYGNKRTKSVMFKEELSFIKNRYLSRFKWINIMSQEDQGSDVLNGKIDNEKGYQLQKKKMIDIHKTADVFICGPESMISEVSRGFRLEGLNQSQIHYELFAHSAVDSEVILEKSLQRVHEYGENKTSQLTLISDGRSINFELATVGSNILDAGIENGLDLPFSCKAGVCSTCKAKVIKGKVDMDISHGLEAHEIEQGFILTCQAHPLSDELVVSFDER